MLLNVTKVEIEQSGQIKESEFGIADTGMIMRHMITTIYSDKIGTVVREIGSNARDAHREFGTPDRPIRIKFPNKFEPTFEVRDWGCGISPDRMQNIFIKMGASTKRGDNTQTGGFGIGAKTPWCYTDTFTIRTTAMENGQLVHREYAAVTDEEKYKLMEMGTPTVIDPNDPNIPEEDRHTGTTISLIIKDYDHRAFQEKVLYFMRYWKVRPELVGCNPIPSWPSAEYKFGDEAEGWQAGSDNRDNILLIDGIPYPLNNHALSLDYGSDMSAVLDIGTLLSFGVGEIDLSLNREQVQYTEKTIPLITARLKKIHSALMKVVQDTVEKAESYWDAHIIAIDARKKLSHRFKVNNLTWKGHSLSNHNHIEHCGNLITFDSYRQRGQTSDGDIKIKHDENVWNLPIEETAILVEKDEAMVSRGKIVSLLEENEGCTVYLIEEAVCTDQRNIDAKEKWKKDVKYDLWKDRIIKLSSIPKPAPKPRKPRGQGLVIKAYRLVNGKFREGANGVDLKLGSGIYVEIDRGEGCGMVNHIIRDIAAMYNLDVIGIPTRFLNRLGSGWIPLKTKALELWNADVKAFKAADVEYYIANKDFIVNSVRNTEKIMEQDFVDKITLQDSALRKWIDISTKVKKIGAVYNHKKHRDLQEIGTHLGQTLDFKTATRDAEEAFKTVHRKYPLFMSLLNEYSFMTNFTKHMDEVLFYINAKDAAGDEEVTDGVETVPVASESNDEENAA